MCWNKGAPRPKHKKWGDRVGAPARLPVELGVIGAVDWFAGFWRRNMPQESVLLLASTLSEFWSPIRNIYSHTNSLAALPSSAPFSRWIHNKSAFQHSPHHICLLEGSSWEKKKNHILLVFESSSSLPSPSSPSSLVPASWRRKEHINPKTALQPFLPYLPWGTNWNWIRQGYQVCSLW